MMDILGSSKSAVVAYSIVFGKQNVLETWVKGMASEALGPLLWTLTQEPVKTKFKEGNTDLTYEVSHSYAVQKIALALILDWIDKWPGDMGLIASQRQFEESLVRMNSMGEAGKESFQRDYDFKRNLGVLWRFIDNKIELDITSREPVSQKLSPKYIDNTMKINEMGPNLNTLTYNKYKLVESRWNKIINLMSDKIEESRYY